MTVPLAEELDCACAGIPLSGSAITRVKNKIAVRHLTESPPLLYQSLEETRAPHDSPLPAPVSPCHPFTSRSCAPAVLLLRSRCGSSEIRAEQFPDFFGRFSQNRIRVQRPGDGDAHKNDVHQPAQCGGGKIAANLASFLSQQKKFAHQPPSAPQPLLEFRAHRRAGQMRRENG